MPTRIARTVWSGSLAEGSGDVDLVSSQAGSYHVSFPKRAADDADGTTSPEELIAAAHSSCFAMQLTGLLGEADGTANRLEVAAEVSLAPDPAGGLHIDHIQLRLVGDVSVDADTFARLAQQAKETCPVSKALRGVPIDLEATVAP